MAAPATIEREKTVERTGGEPAVVDRPSTKKNRNPEKERQREGGETWEVRIYNDGTNTREHVARSLVQITGMAEMTAYQTMMMAHQNGIASVGLFCFEIAESYNDGLRKQGIVSDIIPVDEDFQWSIAAWYRYASYARYVRKTDGRGMGCIIGWSELIEMYWLIGIDLRAN